MKAEKPYAIHWFRRDLRIAGNTALQSALDEFQGRVLGVFFFDETFLSRPDFSNNRFQFFLESLQNLRSDWTKQGGDLIVLNQGPEIGFKQIFEQIHEARLSLPKKIFWNRDYEPYARKRDQNIQNLCEKDFGIKTQTHRDHLILEPHEVLKDDGGYFKVFTPFYRKWNAKLMAEQDRIHTSFRESTFKPNIQWKGDIKTKFPDQLQNFYKKNSTLVTITTPPVGSDAALKTVDVFQSKLDSYGKDRDYPSIAGTSGVSHYLKNGSLTSAQILNHLGVHGKNWPGPDQKDGAAIYLKEIAWREFYIHVMFHAPHSENKCFISKYQDLKWENNPKDFEAWKLGMTGYPIVDAGMRQLNTTGFLHNRVRMIVASFLTKHLLVDWTWGAQYFMEKLLDGDVSANSGGWQWAASTGCDPQPYFRIFNPINQSEKFDPDGTYIKKHVHELKKLSAKEIHFPEGLFRPKEYPQPIVEHKTARIRALERYKNV